MSRSAPNNDWALSEQQVLWAIIVISVLHLCKLGLKRDLDHLEDCFVG